MADVTETEFGKSDAFDNVDFEDGGESVAQGAAELQQEARANLPGTQDDDDLESSFESEEDEDEEPDEDEDEAEDEDDEDEEEEESKAKAPDRPQKGNSRAERAIRQLKQQAKERNAEFERRMGEMTSGFQKQLYETQQHTSTQVNELQRLLAVREKELEIFQAQRQHQEEEQLDPVERMLRQRERKVLDTVNATWEDKLRELEERHEQKWREAEEKEKNAKMQGRISGYENASKQATEGLTAKWTDRDVANRIMDSIHAQILNLGAIRNDPDYKESAVEWKRAAYAYVIQDQKERARTNKTRRAKSDKTTPQVSGKQRKTRGKGRMTYKQAKERGFSNSLEAMIANSPPKWASD